MSVPSRDEIKTKLFVVGAPFKVLGNGLTSQVDFCAGNLIDYRTSQALETNRDKFTLQAVSGKGCTVQSGQMQRRVSLL